MTLKEAALGEPVRIVGFESLSAPETFRLSSMGLREQAVVTKLLKTPLRDPVECLIGPQLVAIESWLMERILVELPVEASAG
ncbi:MAG: ferrous iron transport protein A [Elusimicrobia bacterium]|nr:ferrous iron transport protein A [Elusimicrobiota bacterium]